MEPRELFNKQMFDDHGGVNFSIFEMYWEIEISIARTSEINFSCLEEMQDPQSRTCGVCGNLVDSPGDSYKLICDNTDCRSVRDFFNLRNFSHPLPHVSRKDLGRYSFLRKMLKENFSVNQIYKMPIDLRLDALLSLKLMKTAMECRYE